MVRTTNPIGSFCEGQTFSNAERAAEAHEGEPSWMQYRSSRHLSRASRQQLDVKHEHMIEVGPVTRHAIGTRHGLFQPQSQKREIPLRRDPFEVIAPG